MDSLGGHTRSYTGPGGGEQAPNGLSQSVIWGPPPLVARIAGIRFKKTHIGNIFQRPPWTTQSLGPRQNLRWLILVKESASDEPSTHESFENQQ